MNLIIGKITLMKINTILKKKGLPSFCSSNLIVLNSLMIFCKKNKLPVLIETTSNQVNQYGGYSNKTPKKFISIIKKSAIKRGFDLKRLFFGGDHLGPLPWKNLNNSKALKNSTKLIKYYIEANYKKIHIDTSIKCADDNILDNKTVYNRTAYLFKKLNLKKYSNKIFFVFGTEVPLAGGNDHSKIKQTPLSQIEDDYKNFNKLLIKKKRNIFGLVIEPGMKFMHNSVTKPDLGNFDKKKFFSVKNNFVFEAHSSDYQPFSVLKKLVKNNFKFLKVGPELTYFLTKSILSMENFESKIFKKKSNFSKSLFFEMKKDKKYWTPYFKKKDISFNEILKSKYDRTRYYLETKKVLLSIKKLKKNFNSIDIIKFINLFSKKEKKFILKIKNELNLNNFETINYYYLYNIFNKYYKACGFKI